MHHSRIRSLLAPAFALAACACPLRAEVVPILSDTVGVVKVGATTLTKAGGAAKTLAISPKSTAFIRFATGDTGLLPSEVAAARLTIYFAGVTKPGNVLFQNITTAFTESFPEASKPAPAVDGPFSSTDAVKGQYRTIDVTGLVAAWLATPTPGGFGIAITSNGTANVLIASKEGAGSGHPAVLEIDLAPSTVGGVSAADVAAAANLINAAAEANPGGTIVMRDAGGNFTAGTVTATAFAGSGAGLTNLPASAVATAPPGMVLIPAGPFTMGNSIGDADITDATPIKTTVSAFYMDVNLVSLSLWQSVYNYAAVNGYIFTHTGDGKGATHPVQTVNWWDCVKWCNARSEQAGRRPAYYTDAGLTVVYRTGEVPVFVDWVVSGYRLPTEAEWEKAARGGRSHQRFPWGNTISQSRANYSGDTATYSYDLGPNGLNTTYATGASPNTSPVGSFPANGYGLYDMAGNLFEWCWDWYGTPYAGGSDPYGSASGSFRVVRGGFWGVNAGYCRPAQRYYFNPDFANFSFGFRVVLPPGQP